MLRCLTLSVAVLCILAMGRSASAGDKAEEKATHCFGNARDKKGFVVWAASPRAGLAFTDSEPIDVRVRVQDAPEATTVDYTVHETEGPWQTQGQVVLDKGSVEKSLPLTLPGRGLFNLKLSAKSGKTTSSVETWIAVLFTPEKPSADSPWGIFFTPHIWYDKDLPDAPHALAQSHRLLGASWSRLNFWAGSFGKVTVTKGDKPQVSVDYCDGLWKNYAKALRAEGISIMGEIAQCPAELSSRPNESAQSGDAGPLSVRVKPADYAQWDQLIEKLAVDFRSEIQTWEVWNEPDLANMYWTGTVEDFAEHIKRTSAAFRRGNPDAKIAVSGFTSGGHGFADKLFQLGIGQSMDIFSCHYTDENPGALQAWKSMLAKYNLKLPIWNSEEKSEAPLRNLANGVERSFKFIHVQIGYDDYRPLTRKDLTLLPAALCFSVGAHCIGSGKYVEPNKKLPGCEAYFFQRGDELVGAFRGAPSARLFAASTGGVTLDLEPLPGQKPTFTDELGRSQPLTITNGQTTVPLTGHIVYVNGARKLAIHDAAVSASSENVSVVEAEDGRFSEGWAKSHHDGFSNNTTLDIYSDTDAGADGYWVELKLNVSKAGRYEVLFAGNSLARLKAPRSLSPFVWSIDGGAENKVDDAVTVIPNVTAAPEGVSVLGTQELSAGPHTFRLKLTGRRDQPDKHYALWFDALALRVKAP